MTAPMLAAAAVIPVASAPEPAAPRVHTSAASDRSTATAVRAVARTISRSQERPEPPAPRMADVAGLASRVSPPHDVSPRWATAALTVRSGPGEHSRKLDVLGVGDKVQVTGLVRGAWAQIARGDTLAWVHKSYLARSKPAAAKGTRLTSVSAAPTGVSLAPCPDGSSVEGGMTANAVKVYRAVCAAFPQVSSWGGRSGSGGDHGTGHALDIMCTGSLGDAISAWVRAHASQLGVSYVIWSQHIWSVERASEGWRAMPDRGSTTANHYDHVHVSVF